MCSQMPAMASGTRKTSDGQRRIPCSIRPDLRVCLASQIARRSSVEALQQQCPGLLATFVIHAAGDGCVDVVLVNGPGGRATHTSRLGISQGNYVDTLTVRHVLIGAERARSTTVLVYRNLRPRFTSERRLATSTGTITATRTFTPSATRTPNAGSGTGPHIALGDQELLPHNRVAVAVKATSAGSRPFTSQNLHITSQPLTGVPSISITGDATGSLSSPAGELLCASRGSGSERPGVRVRNPGRPSTDRARPPGHVHTERHGRWLHQCLVRLVSGKRHADT